MKRASEDPPDDPRVATGDDDNDTEVVYDAPQTDGAGSANDTAMDSTERATDKSIL